MFVSSIISQLNCWTIPVCASPLLPKHKCDSHSKGVEDFRVSESHLDLLNKRELFVSTEVLDDVVELLSDLRVVDWLRTDSGECLAGFFNAVLLNKPAW